MGKIIRIIEEIIEELFDITNIIDKDKLAHFFSGSILFTLLINIFSSDIPAIVLTLTIGALKELVWDGYLKKGTVDFNDFIFTSLPVLLYFLQ